MQGKNKEIRWVRGAFYWKIPGDVPGYRSQPDPFQSVRVARNADYQLTPSSNIQESGKTRSILARGSLQNGADSSAYVFRQASKGKSFKWLAFLIVILLMLGIGVVGYHYYGLNADTSPNQAAVGVSSTKQPKVFELILGKQNKTPQSKVRIITHVVVKGDTLWDIAETYVKDPFRYPELAELSKINNPDLIYPYDLVRIRIYE
jgi:LysM repeat protein